MIPALPALPPPGSRNDPTVAAFVQQGGAALPADPVAGFERWREFFEYRETLWPKALRAWRDAARSTDSAIIFGAPAANAAVQTQPVSDFAVIRSAGGPNAALRLLADSAFARNGTSSPTIWAMLPPRKAGLAPPFWGALAAGARGVVYPPEVMAGAGPADAAAIAALNRALLLHGGLLLSFQRPACNVAVLHSQTSEFRDAARTMAGQKAGSHSGRVASAWMACVLAGHPAEIIGEASIAEGALERYKAAIAPSLTCVSGEIADALAAFVKNGGLLIVNGDAPQLAGDAIRLPFAFSDAASLPPADAIDAMKAMLQNQPRCAVVCERRDWIVTQFASSGGGQFFHVLRLSSGPDMETGKVSLPAEGAVYDVFAGLESRIAAGSDGGCREVQVRLAPGQGKLLAVLTARIGSISMHPPALRDGKLMLAAALLDDAERPLKADVSAEVIVTEESGLERHRIYRAFLRGKLDLELPMAINERPGRWQVRVAELFSGKTQMAAFTVPEQEVGGVIRAGDRVDIVRRDECRNLLKNAKSIAILVDDPAGEAGADELARRLRRFGVRCDVQTGKSHVRGVRPAAEGDAIIFGTPGRSLVRELGLLPIRIGTEFIGTGRAMVFFVHAPVSASGRAIVVCAADAAGYSCGAELLAMMRADQEPRPSRFPTVTVGAAAPPAAGEPVEELFPAFSVDAGGPLAVVACDRGSMLSGGRIILAGTSSGRLQAFTADGRPAWQEGAGEPIRSIFLSPADPSAVVVAESSVLFYSLTSARQVSVSVPGKRGAAGIARAAASPDGRRIVLAAPDGLLAIDASGKQVWKRATSGGIGALAVTPSFTAFADERRVVCVNERGDRVFDSSMAGCSSIAFSLDAISSSPLRAGSGASLLVGSRSGVVRCLAVPDGKMLWERKCGAPVVAVTALAGNRTYAVLDGGEVICLDEPIRPDAPGDGGDTRESQTISLGHAVRVVAEAPDRLCFAAASADGRLSVVSWDGRVRRFALRQSSALPLVPITSIAMAAGGKTIVIGDAAGALHVCKFR